MRPWLCPRCKKMNAPWLNQCFCGPDPTPITDPNLTPTIPGIRVTANGSWEMRMDDDGG